ncbi:MAG: hypothetical protein IJT94_05000, partial [Oscillibacter sp.]|nr:hypothetical protein [Oscillibacter sp.]
MAVNYAARYDKAVDEKFSLESQAALATNNSYSFTGVKSVNVYSVGTATMTNYTTTGDNRYGSPQELQNNVQEMAVTQDRSCSFTIDKKSRVQTPGVMEAGKALARQLREVVIPEYDQYVFRKMALAAQTNGSKSTTDPDLTTNTPYKLFLAAQTYLGNHNVPMKGRVALVSYSFYGLLKQDPAFIRSGDQSQQMLMQGVVGMLDGVKIVAVPESRLPSATASGNTTFASFILCHPSATVAPKQLWDYTVHNNPPGLSGQRVDMRFLYDAFVLDNKKDAIWYQGPA